MSNSDRAIIYEMLLDVELDLARNERKSMSCNRIYDHVEIKNAKREMLSKCVYECQKKLAEVQLATGKSQFVPRFLKK